MAAETVTIPVTFGGWTDILGSATELTAQTNGGPVLIFVGASAPAATSLIGLQLSTISDVFTTSLKGGEKVYAKSVQPGGTSVLVIRQ